MIGRSLQPHAAAAATLVAVMAAALTAAGGASPGRARASRARVDPRVVAAPVAPGPTVPAAPGAGFTPQVRLGFDAGDQWEPAIAADDFGHVYVLYPQYLGVPGCPGCPSPTMILQRSADGGTTWEAPRQIAAPGSGQWDAQVVVDPIDGRTVYASWLQNGKSDTVVARSSDFGATWTVVVADRTNAGTDKPALAVRGQAVHVAFNHANKVWVASSMDGGRTFAAREVRANAKLGWALAGGAAVGPEGNVYVGWAGYKQNGGAKGPVNLFVSRSTDAGQTWTNHVLAVSAAPPDCSAFLCGWAYLGAQVTVTVDDAGTVYALWNLGTVDRGPERMYFARSEDGGATWSGAVEVSAAAAGVSHAFPALAARGNGDVRVLWMDDRSGGAWNTYLRRSTDGGRTFGAEADLSTPVAGFSYITAAGFRYPFGDYFEADFDAQGQLHAVFGEGFDYQTPGSIWYVRGR
jgi:hypothetical protein